jgi:hypothetical protein
LTPKKFVQLLNHLGKNDCLSYALPIDDAVHRVLSRKRFSAANQPDDALTRTADKMVWPPGCALLMLDYDPDGEVVLSKEQLLDALYSVCPPLRYSCHIWGVSTSSCLYDSTTGKEVRGISGQRVYIIVSNGTDIPRAGMVLFKRLWLAGFGYIKISSAGSLLVRSIVDSCVWQTNRIDYCAPPICKPPLESRKPKPELIGDTSLCLDTEVALLDLNDDDEAQFEAAVRQAKNVAAIEAATVRENYIQSRVAKMVAAGVAQGVAENTVRTALVDSVLHANFQLVCSDGSNVTVAEVLADRERYHGQTFADPLEPDYHDDHRIARARLSDVARPYIHSFAHGGHKYYLVRQIESIRTAQGYRGDYIPKTAAILDANNLAFARGSSLITININGKMQLLPKYALLSILDQHIRFERFAGTRGWVPMDAKLEWSQLLEGGYIDRFRTVNGVLTAPTICPSSGRILCMAGYDLEEKVFIVGSDEFCSIPLSPTLQNVTEALAALWLPVSQFPYCNPVDQTVMLAAMLTAIVRKMLPTSPGFGFDAPVQASGKTLLLKVLCSLAGETPTISPQPDSGNDEEMRKRIFSLLREGRGVLVIDNIVGTFDSPSLAALVTSVSYSDRVLGESRTDTVPNSAIVVLSGNNLTLKGDLPRRFMMCRIDPKEELPHQRTFDFDPEQVATEYRQELVAAGITLMRAFKMEHFEKRICAGRLASFEEWDDLVRQTICWLAKLQSEGLLPTGRDKSGVIFPELVDPMIAVNDAVAHDPYRERHGLLLLEIAKKFGYGGGQGKVFTTRELVRASNPSAHAGINGFLCEDEEEAALFDILVEVAGDSVNRRVNNRSLGNYLAKNKDRIVHGLCLRQGPPRQRALTWWVEADPDSELSELSEFVSTDAGKNQTPNKSQRERQKKLTKLTKLTSAPQKIIGL